MHLMYHVWIGSQWKYMIKSDFINIAWDTEFQTMYHFAVAQRYIHDIVNILWDNAQMLGDDKLLQKAIPT